VRKEEEDGIGRKI